jgi:uncharacterized integral membrane protein (TIGR00698 family)
MKNDKAKKVLFVACAVFCTLPVVSSATALILGILYGLIIGHPWQHKSSTWSKKMLQIAVVGLGFGTSLSDVVRSGRESLLYTVVGIGFTLLAGTVIGRIFKIRKDTAALISFGTAICGGSAIAAMAPAIRAGDEDTGVALATVFTLNSVALLVFPVVGHALDLSQHAFGTWAGLAIHDTSSVVGAAASFGVEALATATTVKLARAVWIAPLAMGISWFRKSGERAQMPWFIVGFIAVAALHTTVSRLDHLWVGLYGVARQSLTVTLFLIGSSLNGSILRRIGIGPLLHGTALWLLVSSLTLCALLFGALA